MKSEKERIYEENYKNTRDLHIRTLWSIFNNHSYSVKPQQFSDEDLDVWTAITKHSAIQDRIRK